MVLAGCSRIAIVAVGYEQQHWRNIQDMFDGSDWVDLRTSMPRDLEGKARFKPDMNFVDDVAQSPSFFDAVHETVGKAIVCTSVLPVGCKAGRHRAPTIARASQDILMKLGYSVVVVEMALVQLFLVRDVINIVQDMAYVLAR